MPKDLTSSAVLVVGRTGQLATAFRTIQSKTGHGYCCLGRPEVDLAQPQLLVETLRQCKPSVVVNAAAFTAVDLAESKPQIAHAINAEGPARLAGLCERAGIPLIHLSTDYVFNGRTTKPYRVDDLVDPQSTYGATKAAGEDAVREILAKHVIIRTSWLYSESGKNFLRTMLRLAEDHKQLNVVDDQIGSPTYVCDLAQGIDQVVSKILLEDAEDFWGTYHAANSGTTSWYGFAEEIFSNAQKYGHPRPTVNAIPTSDYPTPAKRPEYSALDCSRFVDSFGHEFPPWKDGVRRCIETLFENDELRAGGTDREVAS